MKKIIDINSDVGERPEALADGSEERIISLISSANIACGGHAGDESSMIQILKLCSKYGVNIGAHPSYPDKKNFGRKELNISYDEITKSVNEQVSLLVKLAGEMNLSVNHVKPHGALYNAASKNEKIAKAVLNGVKNISNDFILFGLANSVMIDVWKDEGFKVYSEVFADRKYEADGSLRSRHFLDALITNPIDAAEQAFKIVHDGLLKLDNGEILVWNADTICVHSDTENSIYILQEINQAFRKNNIIIKSSKNS